MKKNELNHLKTLSVDELRTQEIELRRKMFSESLQRATKPVKDNQSDKKVRKNIARMLTFIQQKRAED